MFSLACAAAVPTESGQAVVMAGSLDEIVLGCSVLVTDSCTHDSVQQVRW